MKDHNAMCAPCLQDEEKAAGHCLTAWSFITVCLSAPPAQNECLEGKRSKLERLLEALMPEIVVSRQIVTVASIVTSALDCKLHSVCLGIGRRLCAMLGFSGVPRAFHLTHL